ncbi:MAG: hypothetical protein ACK55Z_02455, partial [bacterium]
MFHARCVSWSAAVSVRVCERCLSLCLCMYGSECARPRSTCTEWKTARASKQMHVLRTRQYACRSHEASRDTGLILASFVRPIWMH